MSSPSSEKKAGCRPRHWARILYATRMYLLEPDARAEIGATTALRAHIRVNLDDVALWLSLSDVILVGIDVVDVKL